MFSCSAARLRKDVKREAKSAENTGPKGNGGKNGNSQFINRIGVYENDSKESSILGLFFQLLQPDTPAANQFEYPVHTRCSLRERLIPFTITVLMINRPFPSPFTFYFHGDHLPCAFPSFSPQGRSEKWGSAVISTSSPPTSPILARFDNELVCRQS